MTFSMWLPAQPLENLSNHSLATASNVSPRAYQIKTALVSELVSFVFWLGRFNACVREHGQECALTERIFKSDFAEKYSRRMIKWG
jgi:hypothetical protein